MDRTPLVHEDDRASGTDTMEEMPAASGGPARLRRNPGTISVHGKVAP